MTFEDKTEVVISQLRADRDRLQNAFDNIRAEIMALESQYPIDDNTPYISSQSVWKIINKHCGGDNE